MTPNYIMIPNYMAKRK